MAEQKHTRGGTVFYDTGVNNDHTVRAIVRKVHRDGDITVQPMFFVNDIGEDRDGYIGGLVRFHGSFARAKACA